MGSGRLCGANATLCLKRGGLLIDGFTELWKHGTTETRNQESTDLRVDESTDVRKFEGELKP